jgi:hypothetical protein
VCFLLQLDSVNHCPALNWIVMLSRWTGALLYICTCMESFVTATTGNWAIYVGQCNLCGSQGHYKIEDHKFQPCKNRVQCLSFSRKLFFNIKLWGGFTLLLRRSSAVVRNCHQMQFLNCYWCTAADNPGLSAMVLEPLLISIINSGSKTTADIYYQ